MYRVLVLIPIVCNVVTDLLSYQLLDKHCVLSCSDVCSFGGLTYHIFKVECVVFLNSCYFYVTCVICMLHVMKRDHSSQSVQKLMTGCIFSFTKFGLRCLSVLFIQP